MMKTTFYEVLAIVLFLPPFFVEEVQAQQSEQEKNLPKGHYTPYELLSSYYNEGFKPFKRSNFYLGLSFSIADKSLTNTDYLVQKVINGERLDYSILLRGGYYTGDYGMAGLSISYNQNKFMGNVFRDPDTIQSNTISRSFAITPNFRSSVPLTRNERLSFFTEFGVTLGFGNSLTRNIRNLDEVDKIYGTNFNLRAGLSPGVTFFVMEGFAFEIQLNVLGYELEVDEKSVNNSDKSRVVRQNVDFNIDILSLQLGLAYYFGSK